MVVAELLQWHAPPVLIMLVILLAHNRKLNTEEDSKSRIPL